MRSVRFVLFSLCFLLLSACGSDDSSEDWERNPPGFIPETAIKIDHPVFSSIIPEKRDDVINALYYQPFFQIEYEQIAEYCNDCVKDSGAHLPGCKKSDHVYVVRHLSSENLQGALYFYKAGTTLYSIDDPKTQFFTLKSIKNPYIICLDFELTDIHTEVVQ